MNDFHLCTLESAWSPWVPYHDPKCSLLSVCGSTGICKLIFPLDMSRIARFYTYFCKKKFWRRTPNPLSQVKYWTAVQKSTLYPEAQCTIPYFTHLYCCDFFLLFVFSGKSGKMCPSILAAELRHCYWLIYKSEVFFLIMRCQTEIFAVACFALSGQTITVSCQIQKETSTKMYKYIRSVEKSFCFNLFSFLQSWCY